MVVSTPPGLPVGRKVHAMSCNEIQSIPPLVDHDHPLVRETAERLIGDETSPRGQLAQLFSYVRDEILFGFPADGDLMKASETILLGMGQCNTKGTLLVALCRSVGIPARMHFSLIKKEIQRGLFTGIGYALMPLSYRTAGSRSRLTGSGEGSIRSSTISPSTEPA